MGEGEGWRLRGPLRGRQGFAECGERKTGQKEPARMPTLPMRWLQPPHQTLKGISNLMMRMPSECNLRARSPSAPCEPWYCRAKGRASGRGC